MSTPELRPTDKPLTFGPRPYQILALTGGGFRGLYSAAILVALEQEARRPLHEIFDMIAGTSIGGILGVGLSCGVSASDLFDAFLKNGDAIFPAYYRIRGVLSRGLGRTHENQLRFEVTDQRATPDG